MDRIPPTSTRTDTLFPYPTLCRSRRRTARSTSRDRFLNMARSKSSLLPKWCATAELFDCPAASVIWRTDIASTPCSPKRRSAVSSKRCRPSFGRPRARLAGAFALPTSAANNRLLLLERFTLPRDAIQRLDECAAGILELAEIGRAHV